MSVARWRKLSLWRNDLGTGGAAALAGCPALAGLRSLNLGANPIGDADLLALARSPHLAGLRELDLSHCLNITAAGLASLAEGEGLPALRDLTLSNSLSRFTPREPINATALRALVSSPRRSALHTLRLSGPLPDGALAALADAPGLARLAKVALDTRHTDGAEDWRVLAASPHLSPRCALALRPDWPLRPEVVRVTRELLARPRPPRRLDLLGSQLAKGAGSLDEVAASLRAALADVPGVVVEAHESTDAVTVRRS